MPQQSKYANAEFEQIMQDVLLALEKHQAGRDLSLMVLGNVLSNIFTHQCEKQQRKAMVEQFCDVLTRSTK